MLKNAGVPGSCLGQPGRSSSPHDSCTAAYPMSSRQQACCEAPTDAIPKTIAESKNASHDWTHLEKVSVVQLLERHVKLNHNIRASWSLIGALLLAKHSKSAEHAVREYKQVNNGTEKVRSRSSHDQRNGAKPTSRRRRLPSASCHRPSIPPRRACRRSCAYPRRSTPRTQQQCPGQRMYEYQDPNKPSINCGLPGTSVQPRHYQGSCQGGTAWPACGRPCGFAGQWQLRGKRSSKRLECERGTKSCSIHLGTSRIL